MNIFVRTGATLRRWFCGTILLVVTAIPAYAQEPQLGTVENLDQDNGSITISGQVLPFSDLTTEVYWGDRLIGAGKIDLGMVVRYTLDAQGTLRRIELIGPNDKLSTLDLH